MITSFIPRCARIQPAAPRHIAPAVDPTTRIIVTAAIGMPIGTACEITMAARAPTYNCPSPPMLKRPALSPTATPRPMNIRGMAWRRVSSNAREISRGPLGEGRQSHPKIGAGHCEEPDGQTDADSDNPDAGHPLGPQEGCNPSATSGHD